MTGAGGDELPVPPCSAFSKKQLYKEDQLRRLLDASERIDVLLTDRVRQKMDEGTQEP